LLGLHAIEKRNKGLINFVQSYRSLTKIPKPILKNISVKELLNNLSMLMEEEIKKENVLFDIQIEPPDLELVADERLISQILINLVKNSLSALKK